MCLLPFRSGDRANSGGPFFSGAFELCKPSCSPAFKSLHLRLDSWETSFKRRADVLEETADWFERARTRRCLPALLGLEQEPRIASTILDCDLQTRNRGRCLHDMFKHSVALMYSSEMVSHCSAAKHTRTIRTMNQQKKRRDAKLVRAKGGIPRGRPSAELVHEKCVLEHFRSHCSDRALYSLERPEKGGPELMPLLEKRCAARGGPTFVNDDLGAEFGSEGCHDSQRVYFSVVRKSYTRSRLVPTPAAASAKMSPDDMCVAVHEMSVEEATLPVVSVHPSVIAGDPVMVLTRRGEDATQSPGGNFLRWDIGAGVLFSFKRIGFDPDIADVTTKLVTTRALPGCRFPLVVQHSHPQSHAERAALEKLEFLGFATIVSDEGDSTLWEMTEFGVQQLPPLRQMCSPRPALALRANLPLADRSSFELVVMLEEAGWQYKPKVRARRLQGYCWPEGEKVFTTTGLILPPLYAQCLLQASMLHASGVASIEPCQRASCYKRLLDGHVDSTGLRASSLQAELDPLEDHTTNPEGIDSEKCQDDGVDDDPDHSDDDDEGDDDNYDKDDGDCGHIEDDASLAPVTLPQSGPPTMVGAEGVVPDGSMPRDTDAAVSTTGADAAGGAASSACSIEANPPWARSRCQSRTRGRQEQRRGHEITRHFGLHFALHGSHQAPR